MPSDAVLPEALAWARLEREARAAVDAFPGVAGIAVQDLTTGQAAGINADAIFPTASTIKIAVLLRLLMAAQQGEVDLATPVAVPGQDVVLGSGVLAYLDGPVTLSLLNHANLMIMVSDNLATNVCIDAAGIDATNALLAGLGLRETKLRRKMMDHLAAVREQENVATPGELVALMAHLYAGRPQPDVARRCLEILRKPKSGFLRRAIPDTVAVASKPGYVEGARCDAGIVELARRPYAVALMTAYAEGDAQAHERWLIDAARSIHSGMVALNASNRYGRFVY